MIAQKTQVDDCANQDLGLGALSQALFYCKVGRVEDSQSVSIRIVCIIRIVSIIGIVVARRSRVVLRWRIRVVIRLVFCLWVISAWCFLW